MNELLASPWIDRIEFLGLEPKPRPCQLRGYSPSDREVLVDDDVVELAADPLELAAAQAGLASQ
ncbi:MAG: hypothetical protein ACP5XB_30590, partial [Isosphaeraceae bacterium]